MQWYLNVSRRVNISLDTLCTSHVTPSCVALFCTITISQNEGETEATGEGSNNSGDLEEGEMSNEPAFQADYNLYSKFWQLQDLFRQPKICFDRLEWKRFSASSNEVLTVLAQLKLDTQSNSSTLEDITSEGTYFAKYLTNQKLFELQLSDSNFRRYILIQFLIAFQFLTSSVKFHDKVLTDEQKEWVTETTEKVLDLISQTPPRGKEMMKAVTQILQREESWSNWKNDGCPEIKPDEVSTKLTDKSKVNEEGIGAELLAAERAGKFSLGNKELTRLWNLHPDNWQACRSHKRVFTPTVDEYFESIVRMPKESRANTISGDASFTWRGLRLLSQKSPHFFTPSNLPPRPLNTYMDSVVETLSSVVNVEATRSESVEGTEDISDDDMSFRAPEETGLTDSARASPPSASSTDTTQNGHRGITAEMVPALAKKIAAVWKDCAKVLTFGDDEILFFEDQAKDAEGQAERMLLVWREQFPDDADVKILKMKLAKGNINVTL